MKKRDQKGITMVSLVVTIIVLLILAGVSIYFILGDNGIIKNAEKAKNETYQEMVNEEVEQIVAEYEISNTGETLEEFLKKKVPEKIDEVKRIDDDKIEVKKDGYSVILDAKSESSNNKVKINASSYTGIYDGNEHATITSITTEPNDAKIEYSTDGTNYNETIPTITNASTVSVTIRASKEGYTTATIRQTAKVNKADWSITLSETSGTLTYPQTTSFTVSGNVGVLSVASSNTNIATANITENSVKVQAGTTEGQAEITVTSGETDNYNATSAIYTVDVKNGKITLSAVPYTGTYDGEAHEALTNVKVDPSDSKLEYSIDGLNYIDKIPTVTNATTLNVTIKATKAGYGMQSIKETVKINKADGAITLSETSGAYTYPTVGTFKVSDNTGVLSVTSSNSNIATATAVGNIVTVKPGTTAGKATITVTSTESINYTAKSATYEATVENGTIKLTVTPYDGAYDGKTHDAIKSVVVSPIDATVEYSTDGKNFTTTKPTIKEVSTVTVTVKATKEGYKTEIVTETINVKELIDAIKIGDYVNYTYDDADPYSIDSSVSGALISQSIIQSKLLKWRILKIDRTNNTIDLLGDPTVQQLELSGAQGCNNGVFLLNDICKKQYSNTKLNVQARSINLKDIEDLMTNEGKNSRNSSKYVHTNKETNETYECYYGEKDTYTNTLRRYYPKIYTNHQGVGINTTTVTAMDKTKSDPYDESASIYTEATTDETGKAGIAGLTIVSTAYGLPINSTNYNASEVLSNNTQYWVAARIMGNGGTIGGFGIRWADTEMNGTLLLISDRIKLSCKDSIRPYVTLKLDTLSGTKNLLGQWKLK